MALILRRAGLLVGLLFAAGCASGPVATDSVRTVPKQAAPAVPGAKPEAPRVEKAGRGESRAHAAPDWEKFTASDAALRADIASRADALKKGAIGNRGVELASLRLAASGRDLIDAGSLDGALTALERAVSLSARNGYACLYLAYVYRERGRDEQAAEFAASARRYLPQDRAVRAELEGLTQSIRASAASAGK